MAHETRHMIEALDALAQIDYDEDPNQPIRPAVSRLTSDAVTVAYQHVRRTRAPRSEDVDDPNQRLRTLAAGASLQQELDRSTPEVVRQARALGATWQAIGEALGMTKQAAQQRFG